MGRLGQLGRLCRLGGYRVGSVERVDGIDRVDWVASVDQVDWVHPVDRVDLVAWVVWVDRVGWVDRVDRIDISENEPHGAVPAVCNGSTFHTSHPSVLSVSDPQAPSLSTSKAAERVY